MSKNKGRFPIASPSSQLNNISETKKFAFGDNSNRLNEIKSHKPVFAFDFLSLNYNKFCFNSNTIDSKSYNQLLFQLKRISSESYDSLSKNKSFHFHEVDFADTTIKASDFIKCLVTDSNKIDKDKCPTVYQFKAFEAARVFGFIYKGVFYLVLFDRNHDGYKRK